MAEDTMCCDDHMQRRNHNGELMIVYYRARWSLRVKIENKQKNLMCQVIDNHKFQSKFELFGECIHTLYNINPTLALGILHAIMNKVLEERFMSCVCVELQLIMNWAKPLRRRYWKKVVVDVSVDHVVRSWFSVRRVTESIAWCVTHEQAYSEA